jgi:polar amino acid transport system substrate-binding protein
VLAAGCAVLLPACSRRDSGSSGLLGQIAARGSIRVATEAAFEPFEFVVNGRIVGYNKDVLDYVVAKLGVRLVQANLPFQGILPGLLAHKFDLVATSVAVTPERARKYGYTHAIGSADNVVVARADDNRIRTLEDLNGLVVATQLASSVQPELEEHNLRLKSQGRGGYRELRLFIAFPESQLALAAGQVDTIVVASPAAAVLLRKVPGKYRIAARFGHTTPLAWVTRPEDVDLRNYIDLRIDELRDSGRLRELQLKWLGFEMDAVGDRRSPVA